MINEYTIRKCAEVVDISIPTSFYWRHKILDAIRAYMGIGNVSGVIEVDEAFFRESFKGDHKKSTTFTMPRKPHKRGVSNKDEKRKRGISNEQICIFCAMDRARNIITNLICKGRMKHTDLERLFKNRIEDEPKFCTDSHKSYIKFAHNLGVELPPNTLQTKGSTSKDAKNSWNCSYAQRAKKENQSCSRRCQAHCEYIPEFQSNF